MTLLTALLRSQVAAEAAAAMRLVREGQGAEEAQVQRGLVLGNHKLVLAEEQKLK